MTSFAINAASMLETLYAVGNFGVEATFSPAAGNDVTCTVIFGQTHEMQPGGNVQVSTDEIVIHYRRADIDRRVVNGETFTIGSKVYTVRGMAPYPTAWTDWEGQAVVERS